MVGPSLARCDAAQLGGGGRAYPDRTLRLDGLILIVRCILSRADVPLWQNAAMFSAPGSIFLGDFDPNGSGMACA